MPSHAVFAYGTLKRGFCRESCWPRSPRSVQIAFARGKLLDVGPYPGMLDGDDWIEGEYWTFDDSDIDATLRELDQVEGFQQPGESDWYLRKTIEVFDQPMGSLLGSAEAYFLARADLIASASAVPPRHQSHPQAPSFARWPDRSS